MKGDLSERIEACIDVENAVAEIYNSFSNNLPAARSFFRELSKEEENHATVLAVAMGYHRMERLPEHVVPESLPEIYGTLDLARNIQDKVKSRDISLEEALEMSLSIEKSKAEAYLQETLIKERDERVISNLKKLLVDEKSHIEKITEFRKNHGI
jgi:rubrerythrin